MVTAPIQNPSANQKDNDLDNLKCLNRTLAKITAVNSINVTQKQFEIYESNFLLDVIKVGNISSDKIYIDDRSPDLKLKEQLRLHSIVAQFHR